MRWTPRGRSRNLEDRRGQSAGVGVPLGIGGILVILALSYVAGRNPLEMLGPMLEEASAPSSTGV